MKNVLRNSLFLTLITAGLLFAFFSISYVKAQPSSLGIQTTATATTTVAFVGNGTATSTYQIDSYPTSSFTKVFTMAGTDSVYLYVQGAASTTATTFTFTPQWSNNNIDWYTAGSQGTANANGVIAVATSTSFTWQPGTTATTSIMFKLPELSGLHQRVLSSASGGAGAVYEEIVLKRNAQGQ